MGLVFKNVPINQTSLVFDTLAKFSIMDGI